MCIHVHVPQNYTLFITRFVTISSTQIQYVCSVFILLCTVKIELWWNFINAFWSIASDTCYVWNFNWTQFFDEDYLELLSEFTQHGAYMLPLLMNWFRRVKIHICAVCVFDFMRLGQNKVIIDQLRWSSVYSIVEQYVASLTLMKIIRLRIKNIECFVFLWFLLNLSSGGHWIGLHFDRKCQKWN